MKYRYLFLILGLGNLIFSADEYKGPDTVEVSIDGNFLEIPQEIFDQIGLFKELRDIQFGVGALLINNEENVFKIDVMLLQILVELLQGANLEGLTFLDLVDILVLADYLHLQDSFFLDKLILNIKKLVKIEDLDLDRIPSVEFLDLKLGLLKELLRADDVMQISWQPQGNFYFAIFTDGSGQLYNLSGEEVGDGLTDVIGISWRPQGDQYFVQMSGMIGRFFDISGSPHGEFKENILSLEWSPLGDHYFVTNRWHIGSIHKHTGELVRGDLHRALKIFWNDAQTRYLIKFMQQTGHQGDLWRLYSADGTQIQQIIEGHFAKTVYWQPGGNLFFMNIDHNDLALFDQDGNEVDTAEQENVKDVYWRPDGKAYFLLYKDNGGSFLNLEHDYFGDELKAVKNFYWRPDSKGYLVLYNNYQVSFCDRYNSCTMPEMQGIQTVYFQPHGKNFFIKLIDQSVFLCEFYEQIQLSLYQQLLVQAIVNRSEELKDALVNTTPSTSSMVKITPEIERILPKEVISILQAKRYLTSAVGHVLSSDYHKSSDEEDEREEFSGKRQNPCTNCVIS